jgi:hypothetical protein
MPTPLGRHTRVYDEHERGIIEPFKIDYMKTTTPAERKSLAQAFIFPALFNYWASIGIELNDEEISRRSDVSNIFGNISFCCINWMEL